MAEHSLQPSDDDRVCVGVVTGAHGLKGLIRVKPFTETPEAVAAYGSVETEDGSRHFELEVANRTGKGQIAVRIPGITDREAAAELKGQRLYVRRGHLPPPDADEFYHADLIGMMVERVSGENIGTVRAVYDFGAGDVLEITDETGGLTMVPFTREAVPEVDLAGRRIIVADIQFEPDEEEENGE